MGRAAGYLSGSPGEERAASTPQHPPPPRARHTTGFALPATVLRGAAPSAWDVTLSLPGTLPSQILGCPPTASHLLSHSSFKALPSAGQASPTDSLHPALLQCGPVAPSSPSIYTPRKGQAAPWGGPAQTLGAL